MYLSLSPCERVCVCECVCVWVWVCSPEAVPVYGEREEGSRRDNDVSGVRRSVVYHPSLAEKVSLAPRNFGARGQDHVTVPLDDDKQLVASLARPEDELSLLAGYERRYLRHVLVVTGLEPSEEGESLSELDNLHDLLQPVSCVTTEGCSLRVHVLGTQRSAQLGVAS